MRAAKIDENQTKITKALRSVGATVIICSQLKNAFDVLVIYNGKTHIVEIKNPESLPKKYDRERLEKSLTPGEVKCMERVQRQNVPYNIITTVDDAYKLIGLSI